MLLQALERGVHFEIAYSPMIRDQTARCHVISNAQALINVCKGRVGIWEIMCMISFLVLAWLLGL